MFPVHLRELRLLIALEQYYILTLNPGNTSNLVAEGSPGGMHLSESNSALASIPVYMYLGNVLLYIFTSTGGLHNSVNSVLGVSLQSVRKSIGTGYLYLGKFLFTLTPINSTDKPTMTKEQLISYFNPIRDHYNSNYLALLKGSTAKKATAKTPAVKVTRISDGAVFKCANYRETRT